ncbi:tryptophanyl-tRNA synthetase, mitochondrial [Brevipalpus obovatus]|uniref:tryptophanyl-tRNA synthetase, mitochondrial n=1 Tax=Brevipalpus obovatus TaxID=246614 RepID=UPI003D9DC455
MFAMKIYRKFFRLIHRSYCSKVEEKRIVFSGIQPTGSLHIGNYFGAIKLWTELQNDSGKQCIFSVVDLHSITLKHNPEQLKIDKFTMVASLLACGVDPEKCILFLQSSIPHHTYLTWILTTLISPARLDNISQYREKSQGLKSIPLSLLMYPVLQSADIILYKANEVPVGEDQLQHMYVVRDLVEKFNVNFGETFPLPEMITSPNKFAVRLKSLRQPDKKMSKSEVDSKGRIEISDSPESIREKIKKAVTDSTSRVTFDPSTRPGVSNLVAIWSLCTGETHEKVCENSKNLDTAKFKMHLADNLIEYLKPFRLKYLDLMKNQDFITDVMRHGNARASSIAEPTLRQVCAKTGLSLNL